MSEEAVEFTDDDLSESDLPIFVDLLDLNDVDAGFLKRIEPTFFPITVREIA